MGIGLLELNVMSECVTNLAIFSGGLPGCVAQSIFREKWIGRGGEFVKPDLTCFDKVLEVIC